MDNQEQREQQEQQSPSTDELMAEIARLREFKDEILAEKKAAQEREREAQRQRDAEALEAAKAKKDVDSLTASYEQKLSSTQAELDAMRKSIADAERRRVADAFVSQHVEGSQLVKDAMSKEFMSRIDLRDGKTVVLDPDGNLTALSVEDLTREFVSAKKYSEHIKGTGASKAGGQAPHPSLLAGGDKALTLTEKIQLVKQHPELKQQLFGNQGA